MSRDELDRLAADLYSNNRIFVVQIPVPKEMFPLSDEAIELFAEEAAEAGTARATGGRYE